MCEENTQILFCTCTEIDTTAVKSLYWKLVRVHQKAPLDDWMHYEMGRCLMPSQTIDDISDTAIVKKLNEQNCFDFEYTPEETDYLVITNNVNIFKTTEEKPKKPSKRKKKQTKIVPKKDEFPYIYPYISFVYRDGQWVVYCFDKINVDIAEINQ